MSRALLRAPWCHQELSRSLFSVNVIPISRHTPLQSISKTNSRAFTFTSCLRSEQPFDSPNPNKPTETKGTASENEPPTQSSSHVPWYLKEEAPISESREISSRDQIPALPEDPPAILSDVLEYTFKDLGLDELKLIDLRGLETPAALGANVIMIIGTARSVKHLNVSADRMCRWLRSTYKLSPYADGLLGRNELKIKLRRKARRARLASRSGAMFDDKDDGITTGWICVNAGVVEESPVQEQRIEGFEGFGKSFRGTRIVVQMFTEEKRADVDLETLWGRALERAEREKQRYAAKVASEASEAEASSEDAKETPSATISEVPKGPVARSSMNFPFQQTRRFHSTRHVMEEQPTQTTKQSATTPSKNDAFIRIPDFEPLSEEQVLKEVRSTCAALSTETTPKLKKKLFLAFSHCVASGYEVPDDLGIDVFAALLPGPAQAEHTTRDKNLAFRVLDYLSLRGTNILTMKVLNVLYKAAVYEAQGNKEDALRNARQVSTVLETFDMPFDAAEARKFMVASFQNRDYNGFWHMWRKLPMNNSPRTFDDYTTLFKLHADLGEEVRAQEVVSTWAPMMKREGPPVPLEGALRQSLIECLVLADPDIAQTAEGGSSGDLARIWRECNDMD